MSLQDNLEDLKNSNNELTLAISAMGLEFQKIHQEIYDVKTKVTIVNDGLKIIGKGLDEMTTVLLNFIAATEMRDNVTHAQGEVVILNQELEKKFGIYDRVRKVLLGILQSVDTGLVSKNSITGATEKLMLGTPRYWLTPSLVALAAWINDDKPLALKGLNEGLKRNQVKTELMFTLINNRLKRSKASFIWLSKFFESQNPLEMPQETVILLGAYTDGIFGSDSQGICKKQIEKWLNQLSKDEESVKSLEEKWFNKIDLMPVGSDEGIEIKYMPTYCPSFNNLKSLLHNAKKEESFHDYIKEILEAKDSKKDYIKDLDNLLYKLVNEYDSDEYELRKKKALAELIIKYNGDKNKAQQDFETNKICLFTEKVSFFDILANSMEQTDMSHSLRKMALLAMKEWIINANSDFTAKYRKEYPLELVIKFEFWSGKTKDGTNEIQLLADYENCAKEYYDEKLSTERFSVIFVAILFLGCLIWLFCSSYSGFSIFVSIIVGLIFIPLLFAYPGARAKIIQEREHNHELAKKIINGVCAEFIDWQKSYRDADANSEEIAKTLSSFKSSDFSSNRDTNKVIIKT